MKVCRSCSRFSIILTIINFYYLILFVFMTDAEGSELAETEKKYFV